MDYLMEHAPSTLKEKRRLWDYESGIISRVFYRG